MSSVDLLSELDSLLREWWRVEHQHEHYLPTLEALKASSGDDQMKNNIWVRSTLLECHLRHLQIFDLLKAESFYEAWCQLERLEIQLADIRTNKEHVEADFGQRFLANAVGSWQALYPYRIFFSSREIIKKITCSICGSPRSIIKGCRHRKLKLYGGEICYDVVKEFEPITWDVVSNPVCKSSVLFHPDGDRYEYAHIRAALKLVATPRQWFMFYRVDVPFARHTGIHSPSSPCPCLRSIKNYEACCMTKRWLHTDHIFMDFLTPMLISPHAR